MHTGKGAEEDRGGSNPQGLAGLSDAFSMKNAPLAQWITRPPPKREIVGSIPTGGNFFFFSLQKIEAKIGTAPDSIKKHNKWISNKHITHSGVSAMPLRRK